MRMVLDSEDIKVNTIDEKIGFEIKDQFVEIPFHVLYFALNSRGHIGRVSEKDGAALDIFIEKALEDSGYKGKYRLVPNLDWHLTKSENPFII